MKRYEIYSDERGKLIDWRASKREAIRAAYDLMYKYGDMTVVCTKTGEVVFRTAG